MKTQLMECNDVSCRSEFTPHPVTTKKTLRDIWGWGPTHQLIVVSNLQEESRYE